VIAAKGKPMLQVVKWVLIALCCAGCAYYIHKAEKTKAGLPALSASFGNDAFTQFSVFLEHLGVIILYAAGAALIALAVMIGAVVR
jgi:hypothetical protein